MQPAIDFQQQHQNRFVEELCHLLSIPSISAITEYKKDCEHCAEQVAASLKKIGLDQVQVFPTKGLPVVFGQKIINPALPTILIYGHYDVQPVDPVELWASPPFTPQIKDDKIYARGSADDKGQFFMHVKAVESMLATHTLPVNVKFLIEGEEEVGSIHLEDFLRQQKNLLSADTILISDTAMVAPDQPSIDVGLRGLAALEITITGPKSDLHSGVYGGAVANPITILTQIIGQLHDAEGHIRVPHFYDKVRLLSDTERALLQQIPFNETTWCKELGIPQSWGEKNFSVTERTSIRPTLELNGIVGGYTQEGSKTVLPSMASAKISCRLVPDQSPEEIQTLLTEHLHKLCPPSVKMRITPHHGGHPYVMPLSDPAYLAAEKALEKIYHKKPVPARGGGSIPIVPVFEQILGLKSLLLGFGLDDDNLHAPNEKFNLAQFHKGIAAITYFHHFYAEGVTKAP